MQRVQERKSRIMLAIFGRSSVSPNESPLSFAADRWTFLSGHFPAQPSPRDTICTGWVCAPHAAHTSCACAAGLCRGRPFQAEPQYEEQAEWREVPQGESWFQNPDAVGKVVIKVACVIVALMVFKRVVRT